MQSISTIGLDIAKSVFQVHGVDAAGQVVIRRQLRRRHVLAFFQKLPPCLVGIEACASSHHWSRELQALGHAVRRMPPAYVKPCVKRQKNDTTDAEAICEAVTRPNMRFVPTKTIEQQGCLMLHRARHLLIRQQTAVINSIRAYLAEFGIVAPVGRRGGRATAGSRRRYSRSPASGGGPCVSCCSRQSIAGIEGPNPGVRPTHHRLASIKRDQQTAGRNPRRRACAGNSSGRQHCRSQGPSDRDETSRPGLGSCRSRTRAGADKLGSISKQGDRYLRSLFTAGALAVIRYAKIHGTDHSPWLTRLLARHPTKVAAIALANKLARMAWAMMARNERYKEPAALAA